jgi:hypothetical protein
MALQLKNKAKEDNNTEKSTKGKYKRKRNVFGKRLTRFGLIGMIAGLAIAFAVVKITFTLTQSKKQNKIDNDLTEVNKKIKEYRRDLAKQQDSYANVGKLIATLPASFDQQATSLDLDRIIILSGLTESGLNSRQMTESDTMPIDCSISTVKAIKINMTLYGKLDDIDSTLKFIKYLTDYEHENFYYIENISYSEDRSIYIRSQLNVTLYTFYNEVELKTETETNTDTNTNTNTNTENK